MRFELFFVRKKHGIGAVFCIIGSVTAAACTGGEYKEDHTEYANEMFGILISHHHSSGWIESILNGG